MARGKYRSRKDNRDAAQLAEDLRRVRAQLAQEQQLLTEMGQRAKADARLRAQLEDAISVRDAVCAPQLRRIGSDRDVIRAATRELTEATREVGRHSQKINDWAWASLGPEFYYALLSGNRACMTEGVASKKLKPAATEAIQRSRGLRTKASVDFTPEQKRALAVACAAATGTDLPAEVTPLCQPGLRHPLPDN